jgi:outer membrane protein assembly factor BamE (lipoprotein component of BamABCDE complex)
MNNVHFATKLSGVAAIILTVSHIGCAAAGTPFKFATARKIQVGMTKAEVIEIMGRPYRRATCKYNGGDAEQWTWVYTFVAPLALSHNTKTFSILLQDGKVVEVPYLPDDF